MTLDKKSYAPGETAKLRIASKATARRRSRWLATKSRSFIDVDLKAGDNVATFEVGADWGAGAYAIALTHRPLDVKEKRMPGRAIGLAWFSIDEAGRKLDVAHRRARQRRGRAKSSSCRSRSAASRRAKRQR